jgi:hypothetical protein
MRWPWRAAEPIATLADGDEVIAHGTLEERDADPLARVPVRTWTLSAGELCAVSPRAAMRPLGPLRGAGLVAGIAVASTFALFCAGHFALSLTAKPTPDETVTSLYPTAIAAAMPGTREAALEKIEVLLLNMPANQREQQLELAKLEGCRDATHALTLVGRYQAALEAAQDCDNARLLRARRTRELGGRAADAAAGRRLRSRSRGRRGRARALGRGRRARRDPRQAMRRAVLPIARR